MQLLTHSFSDRGPEEKVVEEAQEQDNTVRERVMMGKARDKE